MPKERGDRHWACWARMRVCARERACVRFLRGFVSAIAWRTTRIGIGVIQREPRRCPWAWCGHICVYYCTFTDLGPRSGSARTARSARPTDARNGRPGTENRAGAPSLPFTNTIRCNSRKSFNISTSTAHRRSAKHSRMLETQKHAAHAPDMARTRRYMRHLAARMLARVYSR